MTNSNNWNISDIIVSIMIMISFFIIYVLALPYLPNNVNIHSLITALSYLAAIYYLSNKYYDGLFTPVKYIKHVLYGIAICIIINAPYISLLSNGYVHKEYYYLQYLDPGNKVIYLIISCLLIPIEEEILFRGLYYRIIRNRYNIAVATFASVLLFTLRHGFQDTNILSIVIQGLVYTYVYEKTSSVWSSIIVHSFHNTYWYGLSMFFLNR